jgi:hypothetical protein
MERYFVHNDRYVVAATAEESGGRVSVRLVGFVEGVAGSRRRGRRPRYGTPVSLSELRELSASEAQRYATSVSEDSN